MPSPRSAKPRPAPAELLLTNIGQLLTLRSRDGRSSGPRRGPELNDVGIIESAAVLCVGGKIVAAGKEREVLRHPVARARRRDLVEINGRGRVVLPGFVDSHTHLVFAGPRLVDFEKRVAGATYEQIAARGGGIRSSVAAVRAGNKKVLMEKALAALDEMARQGSTTVEAKSGYGLSTAAEVKSLEVIRAAATQWPGTVVPTLLGAHVVPQEFERKPQAYLREITARMIPQAARRKLAQFVDVFCDRGAFTMEQAEQIFAAARQHGLGVRAHVCQLSTSTLWPLLRFQPASFDHMDYVADEDIPQLAQRQIVATLLPGANFFLATGSYPPARKLIEAGVAVALATDYNPGTSPTASMPFVLSLACTQMKMSPAEAICAATINGAFALRLENRKGSIEQGKDADLAIFDVADYREIPYWIAANRCSATIMRGRLFTWDEDFSSA